MYAQTGAQGDALIERIRSMTKEVEVGDEFPAAKVVKTTTFGAFVELAKGTDGLLHISNVSPGQRVGTVEEVLNKGDEIAVRVVEVDRERGRIGLRLRGGPGDRRQVRRGAGGRRHRRRGRRRPRRPAATATAAAAATAAATAAAVGATVTRAPARAATAIPTGRRPCPTIESRSSTAGCGSRRRPCPPSGPRPWASSWAPARAARPSRRPGSRTSSSTCCSAAPTASRSAEIDQLFDAMGAELNAGTDKESTTVYARMLDQHLPRAFDVIADMVWRPAFRDVDPEREVVLEEIAMYEDDPQDTVFDVLGEAVFGDHPLGRPIIGRAPVIRDTPVDRSRPSTRAATCPARS